MADRAISTADRRALQWVSGRYLHARNARLDVQARLVGTRADALPSQDSAPLQADAVQSAPPEVAEAYRKACEEERQLASVVDGILEVHPAMPWIRSVPGLDPRVAGRLLCLLDIHRATGPSSFWAYCGLATVPAVRVRCPGCGRETLVPEGAPLPSQHTDPRTGLDCSRRAERVPGRVATRLPQRQYGNGQLPDFNVEAKSLCRSIGDSLRAAGHRYASYYELQRQLLEISRPHWESGRRHVNALRKVQKLYLTHLFLVWADALHLPIPAPHEASHEHREWGAPWKMTLDQGPSGARVDAMPLRVNGQSSASAVAVCKGS